MRQRQVRGAIRCLLSGAVAVKTKDWLVRHLPQQHELVFGERRTERRNGCGKASRDHRDDVDIAFDHDQRRSVMRGLTRGGEVVEIVALVKQRGFRRVEIFRGDVFLQRTAAEGDDASAHIRDRKHHAIAKTIIGHGNIVAGDQEARFHHVFYRNALRAEMLLQRKALAGPARGIADAELQLRRRRNRAVAEIARAPWRRCARPTCRRRISPIAPSRHGASCGAARDARHRALLRAAPCRPSRRDARRPRQSRRPRSPSGTR